MPVIKQKLQVSIYMQRGKFSFIIKFRVYFNQEDALCLHWHDMAYQNILFCRRIRFPCLIIIIPCLP